MRDSDLGIFVDKKGREEIMMELWQYKRMWEYIAFLLGQFGMGDMR
jgi:hypothetical protein